MDILEYRGKYINVDALYSLISESRDFDEVFKIFFGTNNICWFRAV